MSTPAPNTPSTNTPGTNTPGTNTPGPGGYLLAVLVSDFAFALLLGLGALADGDIDAFFGGLVLFTVITAIYAIPFAVPGVLLVHFLARRATSQLVHVATAGAVGLLAGLVASAWIFRNDGWPWLVLEVGVATAVGRAAVIPLVPAVRGRRQPVDDDFAGTPSRW